jgi:hypothetical protein
MPILSPQNQFGIPLNVSTILSLFSSNNLSCTSENTLVDFNSSALNSGSNKKRFIILPEFELPGSTDQPPVIHANPPAPQVTNPATCTGDVQLERRQGAINTSNGIVFQGSSSTIGSDASEPTTTDTSSANSAGVTASTTGSESVSPTASSTATGTTSTSRPSSKITDKEIEFAQVAVMYVFQEIRTVSVAVNAQQQIEMFFSQKQSNSTNSTQGSVNLETGDLKLSLNFDDFTIVYGNSTIVGGSK